MGLNDLEGKYLRKAYHHTDKCRCNRCYRSRITIHRILFELKSSGPPTTSPLHISSMLYKFHICKYSNILLENSMRNTKNMNSEKLSIVFFGSNHLSVACLEKLVMDERFEVLAVASQTDKPAGRGHKLTPTPVSQYAIDHEIALYRCDRPSRDEVLFNALHSMRPDYFVVVAYGAILPQRYLDIPKKLSINVHGSLLPAYRGASPIQTAILDRAAITGVTIMQMSLGMDE